MPEHAKLFEEALLSLDRLKTKEILFSLSEQQGVMKSIETLIVPVLSRIGDGWENGELSLAQIYMSGKLCEELILQVLPPNDSQQKHQTKIAIAVLEDHHTLGKNIIFSILRANGFELTDYGNGITVEDLVEKIIKDDIEVLLISVLMLRAALRVKDLVLLLKKHKLHTKVIVGGAPFRFDSNLWTEVGATASGNNGKEALEIVHNMVDEIVEVTQP